ncbi:hypothetical protein LLG39_14570, partial [bacterium]|nr:hypothetical protein [bacterium]
PMIFGGSSSSTPAATDPSAMGTAPGDASSGAPPMPGAPTPPGMAPDPSAAGGAPATPGAPGAPAGGTAGATATPAQGTTAAAATNATPMEPSRGDPFQPVGYKPPKHVRVVKVIPPIVDFPFERIPGEYRKSGAIVEETEVAQPVRRMAGLLLNERVYAIIESNGSSEIVQPGDMLRDRLAKVERVEQDKVILKTTGKRPKYLTVRMASAPKVDANINSGASSSSGRAGMPGIPGMPGMPGIPGMPGSGRRR